MREDQTRQTIKTSVNYWNRETWEWQRLDGLGVLFRIFWIGTTITQKCNQQIHI